MDYPSVERITAAHNSLGLGIGAVSHASIASNTIVANINGGLAVSAAESDGVFTDNDVSGNRNYGMLIGGTSDTVKKNTVSGTASGPGIVIEGSNAKVHSNVTVGNFRAGMSVTTTAAGARIFNNTSTGNGTNDLEDGNYNGGSPCGTDLWFNNVFFINGGQACIH